MNPSNGENGRNSDEDICAVCQESIMLATANPTCGHSFCFMCIKGLVENDHFHCALCRAPIDTKVFETANSKVSLKMKAPIGDTSANLNTQSGAGSNNANLNTQSEAAIIYGLLPTAILLDSTINQYPRLMMKINQSYPAHLVNVNAINTVINALYLWITSNEVDMNYFNNVLNSHLEYQRAFAMILSSTELPRQRAPVVPPVHYWIYKDRKIGWWRFEPRIEVDLEAKFATGASETQIFIFGKAYCIDFHEMTQWRKDDESRSRVIKRVTSREFDYFNVKGICGLIVPRVQNLQ